MQTLIIIIITIITIIITIIIIIIIIIVVVVVVVAVVSDDTYHWVYLPSDYPFQQCITKCDKCNYKVRQLFLLRKCDGLLLQSSTAFLLQRATSVITKCDRYYKVRRSLQSATEQTDQLQNL